MADLLLKLLRSEELNEYQLFWFGHILEANLINTTKAADLISSMFNHPRATPISKSKNLELADNRFGLSELRETFLRTGQSDWLSWSAAAGERSLSAGARNHRLETSNEQAAVDLGPKIAVPVRTTSGQGLPQKSKSFAAVIDDYIRYRERDHRHGGTSAGMLKQIVRVSKFWREYAGQLAVEAIDDKVMREFIPWRRNNLLSIHF